MTDCIGRKQSLHMDVTSIFTMAMALACILTMRGAAIAAQDDDEPPTSEEWVGRLKEPNTDVSVRTLGYLGARKTHLKEITPHAIRLLKDPDHIGATHTSY